MADITQTLPTDWKYISEGGATIVFSYVGPTHSFFSGMVLRLRKRKSADTSAKDLTKEEEADDPMIEYQTKCMSRLLPQENLPQLRSVRLEKAWLEMLAEKHDVERPKGRSAEDHIDFSRKKGILATDLVGGSWIAVEVKPKWAFLPPSTHLSEETMVKKTQTCRFCMHSFMRNLKDKRYITSYCPLDLFSGKPERIQRAVDSLWDSWKHSNGSINNIKVFADGKAVKPDQLEHLLIQEDRLSPSAEVAPEGVEQEFKETLSDILMKSPVLPRISNLQRTLDVLDIEGLSKLWRRAQLQLQCQSEHASCSDGPLSSERIQNIPLGLSSLHLPISEPNINDWETFFDLFESTRTAETEMDHAHPKTEDLRFYLLAYLLSATFKDCSIIVKLDFLKIGSSSEHGYPVTVIDLDPKRLERLQRWEKLDQEIVSSYTPERKKLCEDGRS